VQDTLRGDARATEAFIVRMRCVPRMLSALNAKRGAPLDAHDLADVAQDTVLLLWKKRASFDELVRLETWAFGVARYEFLNAVRRKRRNRVAPTQENAGVSTESSVRSSSDSLEYDELLASLEKLDAVEASVVRLKHLEDMTFEAIGAELGIPVNTAKTRYYRAIRNLQATLRPRVSPREKPR
jgi:RNA polymerase sigma-70 factor (ECF subfamily)